LSGNVETFEPPAQRFTLWPFDTIAPVTERDYTIKGILPRRGMALVWGPPKCGKSFWMLHAALHVAFGWEFDGRRVVGGPVVYGAFEGATGFRKRIEAFRNAKLAETYEPPPFYLLPEMCDLIRDHQELVRRIRAQVGDATPQMVVLDTLNRSMAGSESSDEDMSAYVQAADYIREAFDCLVCIVHHCGHEGSRPRGHTSLIGAADTQIAVSASESGNHMARVEFAKDGEDGAEIGFTLRQIELGEDPDGDALTSCVVELTEPAEPATSSGPRLTANQATMLDILNEAGPAGLTVDEWNERARAAGIGIKRKADLYDIRSALKRKSVAHESQSGRWHATRV